MNRYLQTVAISASPHDIAHLVPRFLAAGATRLTPMGKMGESYDGEPHDGTYALERYSKRVSVQATDHEFMYIASLNDLMKQQLPSIEDVPLQDKSDVQQSIKNIDDQHSQLLFHSGGSTGDPALSIFTYDDYDLLIRAAGNGLLGAGFNPTEDRSANLFFSGEMYGSFISFFSILERLKAPQIPLAGSFNFDKIAKALEDYQVNTLFGMPSYLWQLFTYQGKALQKYGGIKKIYYGGENFTEAQRNTLQKKYGIESIRSATYGSTDLGPLGYQCIYSTGNVHHIFTDIHSFEILHLEKDEQAIPGEVGRIIFTPHTRTGQNIQRYQIGDLAKSIDTPCPCGVTSARVELLGRYGDIFRIGTFFYNYQNFIATAQKKLNYQGELQILLKNGKNREEITVHLDKNYVKNQDHAEKTFIQDVPNMETALMEGKLLNFKVEIIDMQDFIRTSLSNKLQKVIDQRCQ